MISLSFTYFTMRKKERKERKKERKKKISDNALKKYKQADINSIIIHEKSQALEPLDRNDSNLSGGNH